MATLGERLRSERERAGLTQEQLAEHVGVRAISVSRWERDRAWPDPSHSALAADALGVRAPWLMYGVGRKAT